MKIAFIIYDGMTPLDFLGVYDPISRLKTMGFREDIEWDIGVAMPDVGYWDADIFCKRTLSVDSHAARIRAQMAASG